MKAFIFALALLLATTASAQNVAQVNTELPVPATIGDNMANPSLASIAAYLICWDGATWDRCQPPIDGTVGAAFPSTGPAVLYSYKEFDGAALPTSPGVSTEEEASPAAVTLQGIQYVMVVNEDGSTVGHAIVDSITSITMIASDTADSGNPLKVGYFAETSVSGRTMVADADRVDAVGGIDGVLIDRPHANLEDRVSGVAAVTDGSSTSLVAAQGSGIRFCAVTLIVSNSSATNVTLDIRDGTGGSVIATIPAAANMGGAVVELPVPLCTTANTAMAADPSAAATTVTTTAVGFKTKL